MKDQINREYTSFFKYCSDNKAVIEGIFEKHEIRFSQPWVLNDPLEFNPTIKFKHNGDNYKWFRFDGVIFSSEERRLRHHLIESKINAFGILSLTKNPDSYDMWSMYANGHKGFMIELKGNFNKQPCMKSRTGETYPIRKVQYVDEYAINIDDLMDKDGLIQEESFREQMFYRKLSRWVAEQEYRIVRPFTDLKYYKPLLNRTPKTLMDTEPHLFEFSLNCVKSVTFGANMCYKNKERIMKACENTKIDFLQAIIFRDKKDASGKTGKVELWDKNLFPRFDRLFPSHFVLDNTHINDSQEIVEVDSRSKLPYYEFEKDWIDQHYKKQKAKFDKKD